MIPRKQLDIGWNDLMSAVAACLRPLDRQHLSREIDAAWNSDGRTLTALSVRSGFDAILTVLDWPPGSEVMVSAVTIRDMPRILREHGLRPVPVDLDMSNLAVSTGELERAVTPATKGILVAHLFGARMAMEPILAFAKSRGLFVFEDCAQVFGCGKGRIARPSTAVDGTPMTNPDGRECPSYSGHPDSDVGLFSFGLIKTATALGGAVLIFRDGVLRDRAAGLMATWRRHSRFEFLRRVVRAAALKSLSSQWAFSLLANCCRWLGTSHDAVLSRSVRGFADGDFFRRIRRQPSLPLLALMIRRLKQSHANRVARRIGLAERILVELPGITRPGENAGYHSYWVLPVHHDRPDELIRSLWQSGFDATRGASSMTVIEPDDPGLPVPHQARDSLRRLLYLPFDESMSDADVQRLAAAIRNFESIV